MTQKKKSMATLSKLYDKISDDYSESDSFDIFSKTYNTALQALRNAAIFNHPQMKILDLGVGDGRFLCSLYEICPAAEFTGIDISSEMLKHAQTKVPLHTVNTSISQASDHLPASHFDLITANFVCAYVGLNTVLTQANNLLKKGGYLSVITSTLESFQEVQQQIAAMNISKNPVKKLVGHASQQAIDKTLVPKNQQTIIEAAQQYHFTVIEKHKIMVNAEFKNSEEFFKSALSSGWGIRVLEQHPILPMSVAFSLAKILAKTFTFPFNDQSIVEVVLFKKES